MQLAGLLAARSSDVNNGVEIAVGVALGLACFVLIGSGFVARRKSKHAKGALRLVGGSALLVLVGLATYGPASSLAENEPSAHPTPSPATATVETSKTFGTCEEANDEFQRLYRQALDRGSKGDVPGMIASAESQFQTTLLNTDCFSRRGTTAVTEMLVRLKADSLPAPIVKTLTEPCRPPVVDAVRLFNTAVLRKAAGDGDAATKLVQGIERLGADNRTCLPQQTVDDLELQLDKAPLGKTSEPKTP